MSLEKHWYRLVNRRRAVGLCRAIAGAGILAGLTSMPLTAQELAPPKNEQKTATRILARRMPDFHISAKKIDDEISKRALDQFLKSLDSGKMYFLQSDVDEFAAQKEAIDDMIMSADLSFSLKVFQRFMQRLDERLVDILALIDAPHDYTVDEEMVTDPDVLGYAKDAAEAKERWRQRIKYSFLLLKTENKVGEEAKDKLRKRYISFQKRMKQFEAEEVVEMFLNSVTTSYDPHTTYFSPSTYENFMIQLRLNLEGIGASLQSEDGFTVIKQIVPGGAADKLGKLKVEDKVVSVGQGTEGEMVDTADMKLDDVVGMIRGKAGTIVRLGVMHEGSNEIHTYSITREKIELKDRAARGEIFEQGTKADGSPIRIGVIELPSFYADMDGARRGDSDAKSTTRDVKRILEEFNEKKVDAVVLDLRQNGGGSLPEAVNCTGLFIDKGPVVQVKDSAGQTEALNDEDPGMTWDGPLVVLCSKFSASASEILAGAIQDYGRGLIIGDETTHGKGTVQQLLNLSALFFGNANAPNSLGALKVTMQQFYRPSGDSTQKRGVLSDIVLPSITNHMDVSESDLDYALEFDKIKAAGFSKLNMNNQQLVDLLKANSAARMAKSEDFKKLREDIVKYQEQKAKKTVTLNEAKFMEGRKDFNAEKEDEKQIENQVKNDNKGIEKTPYLNEVLEITSEYFSAIGKKEVASK